MRLMIFIVILGFVGMMAIMSMMFMHNVERDDKMMAFFARDVDERDKRQFNLQNRVNALEKERGVEKRLRKVERQLRTFCVGSKLEMCAGLGKIKD